jgi:hypothetical protein
MDVEGTSRKTTYHLMKNIATMEKKVPRTYLAFCGRLSYGKAGKKTEGIGAPY